MALFWIKCTSECTMRRWVEHIEPLSWSVCHKTAPQKHPCLNSALSSQKYCLLHDLSLSLYLSKTKSYHWLTLSHVSKNDLTHNPQTSSLRKAGHVTEQSPAYCCTDTTTVTAVTFPPQAPHVPSAELCPFKGLLMDFCQLPVTEGNWVSDCSTQASNTILA